jgi:imidazolonepropionase-like amidohydrolase
VIAPPAGKVREGQWIVVSGRRITGVHAAGAFEPPPGAEVIDLSGWTVLPGLIDALIRTWPATRRSPLP